MNTFGLTRPLNTFGLAVTGLVLLLQSACPMSVEDIRELLLVNNPELKATDLRILTERDFIRTFPAQDVRIMNAEDARKMFVLMDRIFIPKELRVFAVVEDERHFIIERCSHDI